MYTAISGIAPNACLPILFDVGTNNPDLIKDEFYIGSKSPRLRTSEYNELLEELLDSLVKVFGRPAPVVQLEDIASNNARELIHKYGQKLPIFNGHIQGTASMALAGIITAEKITKKESWDQKFLICGDQFSAVGMGKAIAQYLRGSDQGQPFWKILEKI